MMGQKRLMRMRIGMKIKTGSTMKLSQEGRHVDPKINVMQIVAGLAFHRQLMQVNSLKKKTYHVGGFEQKLEVTQLTRTWGMSIWMVLVQRNNDFVSTRPH